MTRLLSPLLFLVCTVSCLGRIGVEYQMLAGNPSGATADKDNHAHYLIERAQYALDYNDTRHVANWVSWNLSTADLGKSGRASFAMDTTLPTGFTRIGITDYSGSGFDRGHLCPSGDRTITVADNQVTFYMSNMMPQTADNNRGVWASFENYCRSLANAGNELLITCGPGDFSGTTIASGVAIPGSTWKIILVVPSGSGSTLDRITRDTRTIAIKIPNIKGVHSDPWQKYLTSAAQIEASTGFTFFSALPAATSDYLRLVVDGQPAPTAPAITTPPTSWMVSAGTTVTLTVGVTGSEPLAYAWRKDGVVVGTTATIALASVTPANAGAYEVAVTNSLGTASSTATLVVTQASPEGAASHGPTGTNANAPADPEGEGHPSLVE